MDSPIRVKNAIRRTKIFRIAEEKYRNDRRKYGHIIHDMACGVVNQAILLEPGPSEGDRGGPAKDGAARSLIVDRAYRPRSSPRDCFSKKTRSNSS